MNKCIKQRRQKLMNFEEMIKKWVKYDYCTPGIKSEVIIDMLISQFIEDIIGFEAAKREGKRGKFGMELIAKEFPCNFKTMTS
jgi:hypothetical protein